jgi:hypothetical protein
MANSSSSDAPGTVAERLAAAAAFGSQSLGVYTPQRSGHRLTHLKANFETRKSHFKVPRVETRRLGLKPGALG